MFLPLETVCTMLALLKALLTAGTRMAAAMAGMAIKTEENNQPSTAALIARPNVVLKKDIMMRAVMINPPTSPPIRPTQPGALLKTKPKSNEPMMLRNIVARAFP